ncbi:MULTISPECIES: DUF418 domain-containing protein [unclassified Pseudoalteromonas]|uniref:DUF418 domain-containing protein n=1 Tax=unclassified Pseudoalteromonas TaxID=194690 RepID=UPI00209707C2|nr:DUF418 domain-containing protein [Pseudoalteromonas sp. XMcav2-N]MCO7187021.1 DUF418 domain-containing protein [Pseudoalteromonas sp. XMcav2-N]
MTQSRHTLLDVIRGTALLGILLMNIRLFSEPYAAYFSPLAYSDQSPLGYIWWCAQYLFADQKFMAIFSMLFGASTALICDKMRQAGYSPYGYYLRRLLVLLTIGLVHAYLIWHGDILVYYALCGVFPLLFIRLPASLTLLSGLILLTIGSAKSLATYNVLLALPEPILTQVITEHFAHSALVSQPEIDAFTGNWYAQLNMRMALASELHLSTFPSWGIFRVSGLMLIGLALYRSGFLCGKLGDRFYGWFALCTIPVGTTLSLIGLWLNHQQHWSFPHFFFKHALWNYWGAIVTGCGYIALLTWISQRQWLRTLRHALSQVGRMALSNYLLQSLLCTVWFYGLGGFAATRAWEAMSVTVVIWVIQLQASRLWLKHHSSGPIERLWRWLSKC